MNPGPSQFQQLFDQLARTPLSHVLAFVTVCSVLRLALHPILIRTAPHRRSGIFGISKVLNEVLDAVVYAGIVVFMLIRPFGVQTFLIPSESMVDTLLVNDFIIANKAIYRYTEPRRGDIIVFKPPQTALGSSQKEVDFIKRLIGAPGDTVVVKNGKVYRNGTALIEPYLNRNNGYINSDWKLVHYTGSYAPWRGRYIPVYLQEYNGRTVANFVTYTAREYAVGYDSTFPNIEDHSQVDPHSWKSPQDLTPEELRIQDELVKAPPAKVPEGHYLMMGDNRNGSYDSRGWGLVTRENIVGRSEVIWWPPRRWQRTLPVRVGTETAQ